jgi:succinate dehydrogenase / fumarate reductase flavoprotein subunit
MRREKCRVLVIGGGLAGLQAAEVATQFVDEVVLVDRGAAGSVPGSGRDAGIVAAYLSEESGGLTTPYFNRVRAALQPAVPADKVKAVGHAYADFSRQLIDNGAGLADPTLVELTVDGIYNRIGWMEAYGLHWQRNAEKKFAALSAPGHGGARVAVLQEAPAEVLRVLKQGARHLDGRFVDGIFITRLLSSAGRVRGAFGVDLQSGEPVVFEARSVILAGGGAERLYSDTPRGSSGDALVLAQQAGAKLANMEFARFLPEPEGMRPDEPKELGLYLLGLRLALRNAKGETFWSGGGTPALLAQALHRELARGPVTSEFTAQARERALQIPMLKPFAERAGERIEWRLGCSGLLGGVVHKLFETGVEGLFVAGEASTGMHGADALAGMITSYNFCSGEEAGIRAAKQSLKGEAAAPDENEIRAETQRLSARVGAGGGMKAAQAMEARIRKAMWAGAGPVRDAPGLEAALKELAGVSEQLAAARAPSLAELRGIIETECLARAGTMVCKAALERTESSGQHARRDSAPAR